jgi:uncharacterized protein
MKFTDENGQVVDIVIHAKKMLKKYNNKFDDMRIYVGTDSQNKRRKTVFVTAIVFRFGTRGAHYIFSRESIKKIPDSKRFMRLWDEVERSLSVAKHLRDNDIPVTRVDLDYNRAENAGSYMVVASGAGYVIGEGFDVSTKPDDLIATKAADHLVRR